MPPTLVRPQTFDPILSPDSASPAVRKGIRTKYLFCLRPSGLCKSIALSAYPDLPSFLRHWRGCYASQSSKTTICAYALHQISSRLGLLLRLRFGWVSDQKHNTTFGIRHALEGIALASRSRQPSGCAPARDYTNTIGGGLSSHW